MAVTINVNDLSLVHQGSGGEAKATLPNICLKTVGNAVVPIPFPNSAKSKDLKDGTTTVTFDGGNSGAIKGCQFSKSKGDSGGDKKGIVSGTVEKEAKFISYSMDVKFDGKNACRLADKMTMNAGNSMCMGGILNPIIKAKGTLLGTLSELQLLCDLMCKHKDVPGKKQSRVAKEIAARDLAKGYQSNMKDEVVYNMKTMKPYMSKKPGQELRPSRNWFRPGSRRPDIVISKDVTKSPTQDNIKAVVEMKFKNDTLDIDQKRAYQKIAGSKKKFVVMEEGKECKCKKRRKKKPKTVPVPVVVPAPQTEKTRDYGDLAKGVGLGVLTVGLAVFTLAAVLCPFDGPMGEAAGGTGTMAAGAAARASFMNFFRAVPAI